MARIDFLVNGVKHRFVLSTATTDSIFPEYLVPSGLLVNEGIIRLRDMGGNEFNTCGLYKTVLESPDIDFRIPFSLNVVKGSIGVLGNDFLHESRCREWSARYVDVVNQRGITVRLPLSIQRGPEEDGAYLLPAVRRVPMQATSQPEPTRTVIAKNVIFFHLETTGFGNDAEIIQIAASCRRKAFNEYILPDSDIHCMATERNGFTKKGGRLFLRGQAVQLTPRKQAAENFLTFLRSVGGSAVLAAHNALPFHAPLITALLSSLNLSSKFMAQVRGVADTLPLFRKALQDGEAARISFTLDDLARDLLAEQVPVNAEETVATLEKLIRKVGISYKDIIKSATPATKFYDS